MISLDTNVTVRFFHISRLKRDLLGIIQFFSIVRLIIFLNHALPHPVLMKPDRVCVPADEFVHIHSVYSRRTFDSLLLSVDKNSHGFFATPPPLCFLGCCQFSFALGHF
jgi:hypothetical protein